MKRTILIAVVVVLAVVATWWYFSARQSSDTGGTANYVGHSPEECMRIRFICVQGKEYFADDKGCGCVSVDQ